ncbi:MAG: membrane protein FdrA [Elusimicrobia bacterium ADurb.Bin231]|nr:MAG: membrane protein FdrA [Elusimicrobia bacterium ADurb.Bin231]
MLSNLVKNNFYRDSVFLMSLSNKINIIDGVNDSSVMMGTDANKKLLSETGFLTKEGEKASSGDMLICINHKENAGVKEILSKIEELLDAPVDLGGSSAAEINMPEDVDAALEIQPLSNIAVISLPGGYVEYQAKKLLARGINVMIFSDNVSVETEINLKKIGASKELLVMGPDCGTAIINGVSLGFANVIRRGKIGIVGASGTGIQEVTTIIHKNGEGITQAIGLGGRDLSVDVGGIMMLEGIKMLLKDENTKVICLISKPPASSVENKIIEFLRNSKKPFVVNFLGRAPQKIKLKNVYFESTLESAALKAVSIIKKTNLCRTGVLNKQLKEIVKREKSLFSNRQKYVRGLFSGGTLCDEALFILKKSVCELYSNIAHDPVMKLKNSKVSYKNSLIDLGDDEFTRGVPHPMIDFTVRNKRLIQEAKDPETAVILFDIVLGYGSHPDPASAILPSVESAGKLAKKSGRHISFVTSICGTEQDPQNLEKQKKDLENAGVIVLPSNALSAKFTEEILN